MVKAIYTNTKFQVKINGQLSDTYTQATGIRQGCPLSPYLFLIVMTVMFHDIHKNDHAQTEKHRILGTIRDEVLFADDAQVESYANDNYGQFGSKPCVDILSNGFKVREGDTGGVYTQTNRPNTIIYCAWAEAPAFNLYGAQSNAR